MNVTALDSTGRPVTDLTSADFQIFEDVRRREITSFKATSAQSPGTRPPPIVILFDLMNTPWSRREYIANRLIKVLNPLETDEGIYLYLLTTDGELYPVRPHGTGQAAAVEQGSIAGRGDTEKADDAPWTKLTDTSVCKRSCFGNLKRFCYIDRADATLRSREPGVAKGHDGRGTSNTPNVAKILVLPERRLASGRLCKQTRGNDDQSAQIVATAPVG